MRNDPTKMDDNILHFIKERLQTSPIQVLTDPKSYFANGRIIADKMVASMEAYIFSRMREEQEVLIYPERQSFWDYVLRRKPKPFTVKINCKDVMKNPPPNMPGVIFYAANVEPIINTNHQWKRSTP